MKDISKKINLFSLGTFIVLFGILVLYSFYTFFTNFSHYFNNKSLDILELSLPFIILFILFSLVLYTRYISSLKYKNNWTSSSTILNTIGWVILIGLSLFLFSGYLKCIFSSEIKCSILLGLTIAVPSIISGIFYLIGLVLFIIGYQVGKRKTPSKRKK